MNEAPTPPGNPADTSARHAAAPATGQALPWIDASWTDLLIRGLLGIVFGVLAMVWPLSTVLALVLLWGAWALIDGIATMLHVFHAGSLGVRVLSVVMGLLAIAAGLLAFFRPGMTAVTLTWLLGLWLIARGLVEVGVAIAGARGSARWLVLLSAVIDVFLGIMLVLNPGRAALGIAVFIGILALLWGLTFVALAFTVRKAGARPKVGSA